jgi:hypothetical protein
MSKPSRGFTHHPDEGSKLFEMSVDFHHTTRRNSTEGRHLLSSVLPSLLINYACIIRRHKPFH